MEEFENSGRSDIDYAKQHDRMSVSGISAFLNDAPIQTKSKTQHIVTLSVTRAELVAVVECVQPMLFARQIILYMGLKVKLPMLLKMDNEGSKDIINSWPVGAQSVPSHTQLLFTSCIGMRRISHTQLLFTSCIEMRRINHTSLSSFFSLLTFDSQLR